MLYTIGHGAKTATELIAALRQHDVAVLVDVRLSLVRVAIPMFRNRPLQAADRRNVAFMCAEPTWWRCHRRMIADLASRDGRAVQHIMPNGSLSQHRMSDCLASDLPDETGHGVSAISGSPIRLLPWRLRGAVPHKREACGKRRTA